MGCNASISNDSVELITDQQINQIYTGTITPMSYQLFLNNFYFVSRYDKFYTSLPLEKQLKVLEDVGPLTKDECITIVEYFCKNATAEPILTDTLLQVSQKMVCKAKLEGQSEEVYIPVSYNQKLWNSIFGKKYKTSFGKFKMDPSAVNWSDNEIITSRDAFINNSQEHLPQVRHNKDLTLLIQSNPVQNIFEREIGEDTLSDKITKASKPMGWEPSIHQAAFKGKKSSIAYNLALLPQILNLPDDKNNTPVHYAAIGNQKKTLIYLHDIGADFKLSNSEGFLPIHLISDKSVAKTMNELGIDLNERNADGETLLDIKTREFDKLMIKQMISLGVNILDPDPNGTFWIQKALHNEYYKDTMDEAKFLKFVRGLLMSNKKGIWNYDPIYEEVIQRKGKNQPKEDLEDLSESVQRQKVARINVLLAIGTKGDETLPTGETNLYLCAKRGLTDSARVLSQNFCDPNYTNSQHENTFWVACVNEHFDTAAVLRDNGADMNMQDINHETLLHNVYRRRIMKIFNSVLELGASPNVKNGNSLTVTYIAFFNRDDEIAEMLQDKYKGDINALDGNMDSLIHHALYKNDLQRIEYLSNRKINMDLKNKKGHSVMMVSYLKGVNFDLWKFLLDKGANISTLDLNNNTMLHLHLMQDKIRDDVFHFLLENKINYDIENKSGQFPISIAIEKQHDDAGFELLNMNCKILDPKSVHEPIIEALNRKSEKWVEALIEHGADAANEKAGVVARYINSGFFKYETFKRFPRINIFVEGPLQMAIYKNYMKCANDLWNMANNQSLKVSLSANVDIYKRIPLSAAIIMKNEAFVNILLKRGYDCQTPDQDEKTPFIHACQVNVLSWMQDLFEIISLKNANHIDKSKRSALTYAAENNRKSFCDYLFMKDISVDGMILDSHGIIQHYRDLLERYKRALSDAEDNLDSAKRHRDSVRSSLNSCEREISDVRSKIADNNSKIDDYNNSEYKGTLNKWYLESRRDSLASDLDYLLRKRAGLECDLREAESDVSYYRSKYDTIYNATRTEILENIRGLELLAKRDR